MLSPFYRDPDHPSFNRRAYHHDYTKPARYLQGELDVSSVEALYKSIGSHSELYK